MSSQQTNYRILMILENGGYPEDSRVMLEAIALHAAGHSVTVVCPTSKKFKRKAEVLDGVKVYRYPAPLEFGGVLGYAWEFGYSLSMAWIISFYVLLRFGFDAIHIHMPPDLNGILGIFYRLLGKKFVMDHHDLSPELFSAQGRESGVLKKLLFFFEKTSCRWAHRLIATNESQRGVQINRCDAVSNHCFIVRNGPADFFMEPHAPFEYENSAGKKVIGYVGVMGIQDGVDVLIRAFDHLKNKLGRDDFLGVLIGNGPSFDELKKLTSELGLDENVVFTGLVPFEEVPSYLAGVDICATPDPVNAYNNSCTTIKTMEYMALSKPTVSFNTIENRKTAGESAVYVESESDPILFAEAIVRLMDDPELCQRLGELGRKRIESKLAWKHQKTELVRLYQSFESEDILPVVHVVDSKPHAWSKRDMEVSTTQSQ
jgi:glycosyltransferase involved in cell wall biosynthesis